ncbi:MAG: 2-dehydropantoate 2-reductase [Anaerolineaceae bacterium]|nr:2-dehydropantoate 2-reductase [Anaerolineaceae bacterium]
MKFIVFGAGAIGSYIGGSLASSGNQVAFYDRKEVVNRLKQKGIQIQEGELSKNISEIVASDDLHVLLSGQDFDYGIVTIKSFDTVGLLEELKPFLNELPKLISFQNGVTNEKELAEIIGKEKIIHGTVTTAIGKNDHGSIIIEKLRGIGISFDHEDSLNLLKTFNEAGLNAELIPNPEDMKWSKMLTNLLSNASSAILDFSPLEVFSDAGLFRMEILEIMETLDVMNSLGIHVVNLPGTPVKNLIRAIQFLPDWILKPILKKVLGEGRGGKMPSFHIDLHSGRGNSEVDYLNGAVWKYGESMNVNTPVNRFYCQILNQLVDGKIAKDTYTRNPVKLIKDFEEFAKEKISHD